MKKGWKNKSVPENGKRSRTNKREMKGIKRWGMRDEADYLNGKTTKTATTCNGKAAGNPAMAGGCRRDAAGTQPGCRPDAGDGRRMPAEIRRDAAGVPAGCRRDAAGCRSVPVDAGNPAGCRPDAGRCRRDAAGTPPERRPDAG